MWPPRSAAGERVPARGSSVRSLPRSVRLDRPVPGAEGAALVSGALVRSSLWRACVAFVCVRVRCVSVACAVWGAAGCDVAAVTWRPVSRVNLPPCVAIGVGPADHKARRGRSACAADVLAASPGGAITLTGY